MQCKQFYLNIVANFCLHSRLILE